jgi:hypothetical protein
MTSCSGIARVVRERLVRESATTGIALVCCGCSLFFNETDLQDGAGGALSSSSSSSGGENQSSTTQSATSSSTSTSSASSGGSGGTATSLYSAAVRTSNPIAYFRFDDENDSLTIKDDRGGEAGVYAGNASRGTAGALPNDPSIAIHFDGQSTVQLPNNFDFAGFVPFSVELWFKLTNINQLQYIFKNDSGFGSTRSGYVIIATDSNITAMERWHTDMEYSGADSYTTKANANTWYHLVATFDGSNHQFYLNGVFGNSFGVSPTLDSDGLPAIIGGAFVGDIDELAIYDRALPATEVAAHYQAQ